MHITLLHQRLKSVIKIAERLKGLENYNMTILSQPAASPDIVLNFVAVL